MTDELHTAAEAARILKIRESWLKTKASARVIPCTFVGKHLRFSDDDIAEIMRARGSPSPPASAEQVVQPADGPEGRRERWRTRKSAGRALRHGESSTSCP